MDQNTQNLTNYIRQQLQNSISPDEIQQQLIGAGHTVENIQKAFQMLHQEMMPTVTTAASVSSPADSLAPVDIPQANGKKRGRIKTGWILLKHSVAVLRGNPLLLRYLGMTYAWIMLTTVIFIGIYFVIAAVLPRSADSSDSSATYIGYVIVFLSYLITYFIINFYAAALAANMLDIFRGQKREYDYYVGVARTKVGPIFVFSLISASVGMFLQYVAERFRVVGWIIAYFLSTAWSLGTMFVLPIIVEEEVGAPKAIGQSFRFFKKTWGESITAKITVNFPLGLIQFGLLIPFGLGLYGAISTQLVPLIILVLVLYVLSTIALSIVGSFANSLINTALYYYAAHQQIPAAFSAEMLNSVFIPKTKKRGILGRSTA